MKADIHFRELLLRLLYFIFGVGVTVIGGASFILSATGTDPFGALMQGVAATLKISNGTAHIAINTVCILVVLLIDKKYIRIGTFAALLFTGPMLDFMIKILGGLIHDGLPYLVRLCIAPISCIFIGMGLACVMNASIGMGGNDLIAVLISDKIRIQFRWVRISVDSAFVVIGYLLGGVVGLGTIICVLLTGPITQFFMPFFAKPLYRLIQRFG